MTAPGSPLIWLVVALGLVYFVITTAVKHGVRNGILEADAARAERRTTPSTTDAP